MILGLAFLGRDQDFEAPGSHLIRLGHPDRPDGVLTFIEAPGLGRGRAGNGMAHLLRWSVRFPASLEYWADRLSDAGIEVRPMHGEHVRRLRFEDPEGLEHELAVGRAGPDAGLAVGSSAVPHEHAIVRVTGARAYGRDSVPSADILAGRLGFRVTGPDSYGVGAGRQDSEFAFDAPPFERGRLGAGTIHHIAWATDGFSGMAPAGDRHGVCGDAGDRPRSLPLDLLPRALWRPLRDRRAERGARGGGRRVGGPDPADLAEGRSEGPRRRPWLAASRPSNLSRDWGGSDLRGGLNGTLAR